MKYVIKLAAVAGAVEYLGTRVEDQVKKTGPPYLTQHNLAISILSSSGLKFN